jgi:hypothetical protein
MSNQFVRCFAIGGNVEFSYDTEEDLRRMYPEELPWAEIDEWKGLPGINVYRLPEGSIVVSFGPQT